VLMEPKPDSPEADDPNRSLMFRDGAVRGMGSQPATAHLPCNPKGEDAGRPSS